MARKSSLSAISIFLIANVLEVASISRGQSLSSTQALFATTDRFKKRKEDASAIGQLAKQVAFATPVSIICILFIQFFITPPLKAFAGVSPESLSGAFTRLLTAPSDPNNLNAYTSLFATLAGVSGVFLGLYFTAISAIASSIYAKVPRDVRTLLLADKLSNIYILVVAHLGIASLILLAAQTMGLVAGGPVVFVMLLVGSLSLASFVTLSARTVYFYDPTVLAQQTLNTIDDALRLSTPKGLHWKDTGFQRYYHRQAWDSVETLKNIVRLVVEGDYKHIRADALVRIGNAILRTTYHSGLLKPSIMAESEWFHSEIQNPNWLVDESSAVSIALRTSTMLHPTTVKDSLWLEKRFAPLIGSLLNSLVDREHFAECEQLIQSIASYQRVLGQCLAIDEASLIQATVTPIAQAYAKRIAATAFTAALVEEKVKVSVTLTDALPSGLMHMSLGLSSYLSGFRADTFLKQVNKRPHAVKKDLGLTLPRLTRSELDRLTNALDFEFACESIITTPDWYIAQILALSMLRVIPAMVKVILSSFQKDVIKHIGQLESDKHPLLACHLTMRSLECCSKLSSLVDALEHFYSEATSLRRMSDIPWVENPCSSLRELIYEQRRIVLESLSKIAPHCMTFKTSTALPDYFGQVFSVLANESFKCLRVGDAKLFIQLSSPLVPLAIVAFERLMSLLENQNEHTRGAIATDPLIDAFDISGYAFLFSELRGIDFWTPTLAIWNKYCGSDANGERAKAMAGIAKSREIPLGLTPRDLLRSEWTVEFRSMLRDQNLVGEYEGSTKESVSHSSEVVRRLFRSDFYVSQPHDIFYAVYLFKLESVKGAKWPRRALEISKLLEGNDVDESVDDANG